MLRTRLVAERIFISCNVALGEPKQVLHFERKHIEALASVLAGSNRPLIVTTGAAGLAAPGQIATEDMDVSPDYRFPRVSEQTALSLTGVSFSVMRLPQVHDTVKQGLVSLTSS
jgi:hypothetical protein